MSTTPGARGTARPIRTLGDPVLRTVCDPVTVFDAGLRSLVEDMFASMYAAEGVGLAANQIGVGLAVFVYDCPTRVDDEEDLDGDGDGGEADDAAEEPDGLNAVGVVVNPVLVATSGEVLDDVEGCLSLPGMDWETPRPELSVVEGLDLDGRPVTVHGTGMLARCLQHETEHLNGLVYLDRLPRRQRGRAFRHWDGVAGAGT